MLILLPDGTIPTTVQLAEPKSALAHRTHRVAGTQQRRGRLRRLYALLRLLGRWLR